MDGSALGSSSTSRLRSLPRHSVDMLLTDPPYGTTRNFWDVPLPLPELWEAVKWAVKPDGAILFFAQCPYDKVLGTSNLSMLRYVNVPNDLSKIKTKLAFNLTKRQLVCFGIAAAVGIPSYLLAMYKKNGLPFEKVVRNVLRAKFLRPGVRPYQTENIYAPFTQRGTVRKEDAIAE